MLFLDVREHWTLPRTGSPGKAGPPKTIHNRRKIPVHSWLEARLDDWLKKGWAEHGARAPREDDYLFPDASGQPFREERCDNFLADVAASGCDTSLKGVNLELYSLRHTFASVARRAGVAGDARDRLLGHRPKDSKALHYEDEDLAVLAAEIEKIPRILDPKAKPASAAPTVRSTRPKLPRLVTDLVTRNMHASGAQSVSVMITAEEKGFEPLVESPLRRFSKPLP